jgi:hypothetical protein
MTHAHHRRPFWKRLLAFTLLAWCAAGPALAYTVYLKDGTKLIAREKYRVTNGMAIIVLQNGTTTSIRADEIDVARSEQGNQGNYGTAVVIDDSGKTQDVVATPPPPKRPQLQDLIASREIGPPSTASKPRPAPTEPSAARAALPQAELAAEIRQLLREQGVEEVAVLRGSRSNRPLLELTTNSEAAIFRALHATAAALIKLRSERKDVEAFELTMATSGREVAGKFEMTPAMAEELAGKKIQASAFFVKHVQF